MAQIPQTLKGFRDFLPQEKRARDFVAGKIIETFERFGFEPIETPTLEYAALLLGKYGDEADKLVYTFTDRGNREVGLRYDQTVPTARLLAQNQESLPKYFRRYQIQNVFRADKPQRGRYREFTQCDADIFGSTSPLSDAEILSVFYAIYADLGLDKIVIEVNDRETLIQSLNPFVTSNIDVYSIIQSIDKLDKIPAELVISELIEKGLPSKSAAEALETIRSAPSSLNLKKIIKAAVSLGIPESNLLYRPTLARGLDYYTGLIFEAKFGDSGSSLGGGGRYDNLIQSLSGLSVPAVGFGLGFDRTVETLEENNLISIKPSATKVMVTVFNESTESDSLKIVRLLRTMNINTELYPSAKDKLVKQFKYADTKHIPQVIIIGPEEIAAKTVTVKSMNTGKSVTTPQNQLISTLLKLE